MIGALILGFLAGTIARFVMPDAFNRVEGWKSWALSTLLGLVGAWVGWLIFTSWIGIGDDDIFDLGGILSAIIGTMIVLPIFGFIMKRTGRVEKLEN